MKLYRHFDKDKLMEIAKQANNKQIVKDVSYAAFKQYHDGNVLCEWIENTAFIIFLIQKENVRVIGLCTTIQNRGGGYAKMLLRRVEKRCKEEGLTKVQTVSKSGADFYVNQGYDIIGIRHGDYILEKEV